MLSAYRGNAAAVSPSTSGKAVLVTGSAVSAIAIGIPVTGGGANRVLYEDSSQNLAAASNFTFNGTTLEFPSAKYTSVTYANLPAAASSTGLIYRVSDLGTSGAGLLMISNGTRWLPLAGSAYLASQNNPQTVNAGAAETIVFQYLMPAGLLAVNDRLRVYFTGTKAGGTTATAGRIRMGTAGTTADTQITFGNVMTIAGLSMSTLFSHKITAATTVQPLYSLTSSGNYTGSSTSALQSAVTISNVSNALYISLTLTPGATDASTLTDATLEWIVSP